MPTLPAELILLTLSNLPRSDALSIPTLLSCRLVSSFFSALSKVATVWAPHVCELWAYHEIGLAGMDAAYHTSRREVDDQVRASLHSLVRASEGRLDILEEITAHGFSG